MPPSSPEVIKKKFKRVNQTPRKTQEDNDKKIVSSTLKKSTTTNKTKPIVTDPKVKRNNKNSFVWNFCRVENPKKDRNAVQPVVCRCGFKYENYIPNNGSQYLKKHLENHCSAYKASLEEKDEP